MIIRRSLLILIALIAFTLAASAHDTWLIPRSFSIRTGTKVLLDLTSGMSFPTLDTSIKRDRIDVARVRINGRVTDITNLASKRNSLSLLAQVNDAGTAVCWIDLKPRQLELTPDLVEEYFAEIDASREIREAWQNMKAPKRWREVYVKHAKTYVKVGENSADNSWSEPVGMSLEMLPLSDPTSLKEGDAFAVRVLKNGVPYPNFPVGLVLQGTSKGSFRTTDNEGRAVFVMFRTGKYLLRGTDLRRSDKPDLEWESDFTTLTVEVR